MRPWPIIALGACLIAVFTLASLLLGHTRPPTTGVGQTTQVENLRVTVLFDQAALGPRVVDVTVQDAAGQPADVRSVRLRFSMNEMDMGAIEADAQPVGQGRFQARGSFFTMAGPWTVNATLLRDGSPPMQAAFVFPVAAPGEASGPLNPLKADTQTILAGQQLYLTNCVTCHGSNGKGGGPAAAGLNPRPADFTQHMLPGKHTDGQVYLWIKDGFPGTAMPAWGQRLSDEQIWQLVTYLRTFAQNAPVAQVGPTAVAPQIEVSPRPTQPPLAPESQEPLPPLVLARQGNIWRSDGSRAAPRQITHLNPDNYAAYPTIAADGGRIAFVAVTPAPVTSTVPLPNSALYVMNADGTGLHAVWRPAQGLLSMPAWTPDGRALYVAANGVHTTPSANGSIPALEVIRLDLTTGATQLAMQDALDPTISRDGRQIAYLQIDKGGYLMTLMVANLDGSGARAVLRETNFAGFYAPRFSPDGKRIVVAAVGGPETDEHGNPIKPKGQSPLQRLLGFFAPPVAEAHGAPWDLWIVNSDGSGLRRLTTFYEDLPMAAFSPDGAQIAMMGASGIYLMSADGSHLRRIDRLGEHGGIDWARGR